MNSDKWQEALADEVRAELGRQNRSARSAYMALGISSSTWQGYFKRRDRAVPSDVLIRVAAYLGMPLSELVRRTEAREVELSRAPDPEAIAEDALSQLPAASREAIRRVGEDLRPKFTGDNGNSRSQGA